MMEAQYAACHEGDHDLDLQREDGGGPGTKGGDQHGSLMAQTQMDGDVSCEPAAQGEMAGGYSETEVPEVMVAAVEMGEPASAGISSEGEQGFKGDKGDSG